MEPTNGHTLRDVEARLAFVEDTAVVSSLAVVGAPGEWRGRVSVHPAVIGDEAVVREGARVHAGCERPTVVGARTLIMAGAHIGHDAHIGTDCDVAPNAVIGGCVTIGHHVKIGMGATVKPWVTIGARARIGQGAVVLRDIPAGETWVGNPARKIATAPPVDTIRELDEFHHGEAA